MPYIWNPEHAVGHAEIDRQHRELCARVNALLEAMQNGRGTQESARLLAYLEEYAREHFELEEREMAAAGYPDVAAHAAAHAAFASTLGRLKGDLVRAPNLAMPVLQIQRHICDWLTDHLGCMDAAFARFLRARP